MACTLTKDGCPFSNGRSKKHSTNPIVTQYKESSCPIVRLIRNAVMAYTNQEYYELAYLGLDRFTYPPPLGTKTWSQELLYGDPDAITPSTILARESAF